jgi:hypothetical protein
MAIIAAIPPDQSSDVHRLPEPKPYFRGVRGGVRARRCPRAVRRTRVRGCLAARRMALVGDLRQLAGLERRCRLASRRGRLRERSRA